MRPNKLLLDKLRHPADGGSLDSTTIMRSFIAGMTQEITMIPEIHQTYTSLALSFPSIGLTVATTNDSISVEYNGITNSFTNYKMPRDILYDIRPLFILQLEFNFGDNNV